MQVNFPYQLDGRGRTAEAGRRSHVRHLIEQLLFTSPGERVNRPDFGCGLLRELFNTSSNEELVATQFLVLQALGTWLSEVIEPREVELEFRDDTLYVRIEYVDLEQQEPESITYEVSAF